MSIQSLQDSKQIRSNFKKFGRTGISERVVQLVDEFTKGNKSYFSAIHLAGQLRALAQCAGADSYWDEKQSIGYHSEMYWLDEHKATIEKNEKGEVTNVILEEVLKVKG